ncbi:hypothetical protein Rhe02_81760 [Rhizocola hellebori]|uniref:Uncharacterized protein n=1 Tax=Rhizocola hellebori TaxID=1392758 RepID=A0A8J3QFP6_9ACTN|nr:hypothetical protein [Rhizocola hellebori]GIH10109.1 hypothetical protein Rhe02_81760 [Rhizocola hellebori]
MRVFDLLLRLFGIVLSVLMAVGSAVLEATATPGFWVYPVVAAIAGNAFLVWFAHSTVDRSWAPWIPALAWSATMIALVGGTSEGDQIANSVTGLATFAAGALTFFVAVALRPRSDDRRAPF